MMASNPIIEKKFPFIYHMKVHYLGFLLRNMFIRLQSGSPHLGLSYDYYKILQHYNKIIWGHL
ncbi:hypothetical protein Lalb_Chr05g0222831 [Lupinus albus]|uniref:Uncharacterized protein n=1 Tax=Lupinus albus TaxID=3870 RepID=A0A6A4QKE2_LUPAL|nr:hypothetical protein Lalb_Chr05g0222831 [Lupinus albus]